MFSRRRSSSPSLHSTSPTTTTHTKRHSHSLLHKPGEDASIVAARERVMSAEAAEREADRALFAAKAAVREAREHVGRLEREASEEARRAKAKQVAAKSIGRRGKALGRHDHV
jgi:type IV secretory pathway VirD2 relaxase